MIAYIAILLIANHNFTERCASKTAFSTNGNSIEERIEPAFGRCKNFLIVDSESGDVMVVPIRVSHRQAVPASGPRKR
jgi:predicted Fe-Mo cluster-binding NifX family protein